MQVLKVIYIICAIVAGLAIIVAAVKSKRARHYLIISALIGIAALIVASITGFFRGRIIKKRLIKSASFLLSILAHNRLQVLHISKIIYVNYAYV